MGDPRLVEVVEPAPLANAAFPQLGEVEAAHYHVQGGCDQRVPGGGRQHIVGAQHGLAGFQHRHPRKRHVDRHLVAVEVRVERGARQGVNLDGVAFDEHRHEGLDAQPVQGGRPVQHHRPVFDHVFQDVPNLGPGPLHHSLGVLDVGGDSQDGQAVHHEGLEQLQRHPLGQATLVHLEFRPDHDHGAAAVVHPLAQQVLAEAALLAAQQVGQGLELVIMASLDGAAPAPVVDQGVHRLLEHPLFVADNYLWRSQVGEALQPVVPVDDPAVEVVEVAGGEPASIQLDHGPQLRRQNRQHGEDHVCYPVIAVAEGLDDPQPLDGLLTPLAGGGMHLVDQVLSQGFQVDGPQDGQDGLGPHCRLEDLAVMLFKLPVAGFGDELVDPQVLKLVDHGLELLFQL